MKLLTEELRRRLPPLYSQENTKDPTVHAKFFTPDSNWTWFATEGSEDEGGVNHDGPPARWAESGWNRRKSLCTGVSLMIVLGFSPGDSLEPPSFLDRHWRDIDDELRGLLD